MSIVPDRFEFLNPVHKLLSHEALAVPLHDPSVKETQEFKMNVNDRYFLYTPDRQAYGHFIVKQWLHKSGDAPTRVVLEDMQYGAQVYLSHFQIAHLNANNQIRPVSVSQKDDRGAVPGSALVMTAEELKEPKRRAAYLDAIADACRKAGLGQHSRKIIKRVIAEVAEKLGETPPSVPTVYRWIGKQEEGRYFDRMLALAPMPRPGNRRHVFARRVEEMVSLAIQDAVSGSKGTWLAVDARIRKLCSPEGEYADLGWMFKDGKFQMSDRTVQRRLSDLDHFTHDFLTYGPEFAERKHATRARIERPTRPLDVVDVDHTDLDIVVIDDEHPVAYGRPDLLTFRDRHSGIVLGFELSFGTPSFDTFLSGLRNAIFPKRPEELPEGVEFPWYGRPSKIGVDNALHFLGYDIQNAAIQLGFQTVEYRPGHPHEKGAEEHLFHLVNQDLVHRLPGTTTGSIDERKMFDEIKQKGVPILTMQEVRGFLYRYFAEIHNRRAHAGLGHIARAKGVPADLWEKGIALSEPVVPVDEEIFVRLAGNCKYLTIQQYGIQWSHITYQDPSLQAILLHPHHKQGRKYMVIRDPKNLDHVWAHDPYSNRIYLVPATPSDQKYAKGLSKFQHEKVMQYHLKRNKAIEDASALYESMAALQNELMDLHALRKKHNTAHKLARFLGSNQKRLQYTRTIEVEPTPQGGGRIDFEAPTVPSRKSPVRATAASEQEPDGRPPEADDAPENPTTSASSAVDKIDDIRARNAEWDD